MRRKKVLVFPCGSEIGLEIYASLVNNTHFELIGGNSVPDHGRFVYESYIGDIPFITEEKKVIKRLKEIVTEYGIDAIYPTMDSVITHLKNHEKDLGCSVVSSPKETAEICSSKKATYEALRNLSYLPRRFDDLTKIDSYPIFIKPSIGYGSVGAKVVYFQSEAHEHLKTITNAVITEYLPGEEYTVDCFTDRFGQLLYASARKRNRVLKGISVNTTDVDDQAEFSQIAKDINEQIKLRGAWFFQVKRDSNSKLKLLEVASRLGGSSALQRMKGVNFAALSLYDTFEMDVDVVPNVYSVELDKAFYGRYKINYTYTSVYIDYDDTILIKNKYLNEDAIRLLSQCINRNIKIILITRHKGNLDKSLEKFRIYRFFDDIIHIQNGDRKSKYIKSPNSIFIDDSHAERLDVSITLGIPSFSCDMIQFLLR